MAGGGGGGRSLKETPTWAVAVVCTAIILVSVVIEHGIHLLQKWFQKRQKKAMLEALEKMKGELMLLGFISLLLAVLQQPISKICVPQKIGTSMLPCKEDLEPENVDTGQSFGGSVRRLLWNSDGEGLPWHRVLAGAVNEDYCYQFDKKVPLISQSGIHQLHIFIFVLAAFHVLYSILTMGLAQAKMKRWKVWEAETTSSTYKFSNDPSRFRLAHQTSFVRRHGGFYGIPGIRWIVAFFRQFTGSVAKVDYLTLRHGFINAHLSPNSNFDFHKYIKRSLEDDFKVVVGISLPLWFLAIIMMLLNVYGWYSLYWISFLPLLILLLVGTKLEVVISELANQILDRNPVILGPPTVQPSDELFWFGHPEWILKLIHLTLFENAFQVSHFLWTWFSFGLKSCFHANLAITLTRILMGLALQILCSYITFPLYALVTQMGSNYKRVIFEEQISKALQKWRQVAKDKKRLREIGMEFGHISSGFTSPESTPRQGSSPMPLLHKHRSDSADVESASAPISPPRIQPRDDVSTVEHRSFVLRSISMPRGPTFVQLDGDNEDDFAFTTR